MSLPAGYRTREVHTPYQGAPNNVGEQEIRPAVLWRKGSFGSHSPDGSRFVERMLTVVRSLRKQGRAVLEFLVQAITAYRRGRRGPSLLPEPDG